MHAHSPYHSSSTDLLLKRFRTWRRQYLHIVIYTSLFWIFVDVFFIMIFSDCTKQIVLPCPSAPEFIGTLNNQSRNDFSNRPFNPKIIIDQGILPKDSNPKAKRTESTTTTTTSKAQRKWWEIPEGKKKMMSMPEIEGLVSFKGQQIHRIGQEKVENRSSFQRIYRQNRRNVLPKINLIFSHQI